MSRSTKTRQERSSSIFDLESEEYAQHTSLLRLTDPSRRDALLAGFYVFVIALAVRITYVVYDGGFGYEPKADSFDFHMIALSLSSGNGFSRLGPDFSWQPTAYRMPGTPVFLAGIYRVVGVNPFVARMILAVIGSIACATLVRVGGTAFGRHNGYMIGFVAGMLASADPFLVMNQTLILLEPLHIFLVALLIWAAVSYRKRPDRKRLAAISITSALVALNRPDGFAYGLIAAAVVLMPHRIENPGPEKGIGGAITNRRISFLRAGCVIAAMIAALLPWMIRNYKAMGAIVPLTTASGDLLLGANNAATYSRGPFLGYWAYGALTTGESGAYGFAGEVRADRERRRLAAQFIADHPLRLIVVVPVRILRGWDLFDPLGNARFGESWGRPAELSLAALAIYYPGIALAAWSAYVCRKRWRDLAILYLLPAYLTVLFAVATGEPRYRVAAHPVIWIFAAFCIVRILQRHNTASSP